MITLAKGQNDLVVLLSYSKTISLTLTSPCTLLHFMSHGIYSLIKRFQYILDRLSTTLHLCRLSISSFTFTTNCAFKDRPDIERFGVNAVKPSVSSLTDVKMSTVDSSFDLSKGRD